MAIMRLSRSMRLLETALVVLLAVCQQCLSTNSDTVAPPEVLRHSDTVAPPEVLQHSGTMYAACKMKPSTSLPEGLPKVYGQALFKQDYPNGTLQVLLRFSGFPVEGTPEIKAVHIHQYGDLSQGCDSTGGHYNPYGVDHPGHPGDFGNFWTQQGKINAMFESEATLFGGLSVIGRAVVIHEKIDDLGLGGNAASLLHGNAGRRLGCCVIGITSPGLWDVLHKMYTRQLRRN